MKNTLLNLLTLGALALTGACSSSDSTESDVVKEITAWKDKTCECKDKECATKQNEARIELGGKYRDRDLEPSDSDLKKLDKLADEGQACLAKHDVNVDR